MAGIELTTQDSMEPRLGLAQRPGRWFWAFVLVHLVVWTLLPTFLYTNIPLDCVELHAWGQQWELGYYKHPPLPAWTTRALAIATGQSDWALYLATTLCVVASFWAAWRLGRDMVSPQAAVVGALLLECCLYYNFEATILNNNTMLFVFWAFAVVAFWMALRTDKMRYWVGLGAWFGLGLLTKYTIALLGVPMVVFLLWHPQARTAWRRPGPYLAALIAVALFAPHLAWTWQNEFPTLHYAAARTAGQASWSGHLLYPLRFLIGQAAVVLLPMSIVLIPLAGFRWRRRPIAANERFAAAFLVFMVLGPFALYLLLSAVLNLRIRAMHGSHLWTFAGLMLVFFLQLRPEPARWRRVYLGCAVMGVVFAGVLAGRCIGGYWSAKLHRELFPGPAFAREVEAAWDRHGEGPLPAVAGDEWFGGNVAYYGRSRPIVYGVVDEVMPPDDPHTCAWMDDRRFAEVGGVFLWDNAVADCAEVVRRRFPSTVFVDVLTLPRPTAGKHQPPLRIGVAVVASSTEPLGPAPPDNWLEGDRP